MSFSFLMGKAYHIHTCKRHINWNHFTPIHHIINKWILVRSIRSLDNPKRRNVKWKVNAKGRRVMIRKVNVNFVPRPFGWLMGLFGFVLIDLVDQSVRLITHCSGSLVGILWYDAMSRRHIYHHHHHLHLRRSALISLRYCRPYDTPAAHNIAS